MNTRDRIEALVKSVFPECELHNLSKLTGGVSAESHKLSLRSFSGDQSSVVLRIFGEGNTADHAQREFDLLKTLSEAGTPVPEPVFVDAEGVHFGRPALLLSFIEGSTEPPKTNFHSYIDAMAETLLSLHQQDTKALPTLPKRLDPLDELFDFLPSGEKWGPLREWLGNLGDTAFRETPKLLHGDYWPLNLIFQGGHVAAVIDWEDAALGDPLSDVACACLELRYLYGEEGFRRFKSAYSKAVPIDEKRFSLWSIYVAAAAQKFMGDWKLEPSREAHMRQTALDTIKEASTALMPS